jgi:hypothetical protein
LAWTANIHASDSKRSGGYVILGFIGQCGPLLGQYHLLCCLCLTRCRFCVCV